MKVNKKALYSLAQYYDNVNSPHLASKEERYKLAHFVVPCIHEPFVEKELFDNFSRMERFFNYTVGDIYSSSNGDATFRYKINDANIAKLLRYIARNGKFPRNHSLRYV